MAFDYTNLYPDTSGNGGYTKSWNYTTVTDSIAVCSASGYFNKVASRLGIGDNIVIARVDAFPTSSRTTLVEYATLYVSGISGGIVTTTPSTTGLATTAYVDSATALKANVASPTFTGTPAAPTAAVDTNTTQLATTAMVLGQAASATPLINGAAAVGTSTRFARADHVHPTDTTRQAALTAGQLPGTATNDSATAGNVGEYVTANGGSSGTPTSLTSVTAANLCSISLTAGDWDVEFTANFQMLNASTSYTQLIASISTTSATTDNSSADGYSSMSSAANVPGLNSVITVKAGRKRISLTATTTVYGVVNQVFSVSTLGAWGQIRARRIR